MPLQILGGQFRASLVWLNASGGGCLLWKCAAGKLEASGGPCARFLFGTEMDEDEQALQIKHGALEAHITCLRFHVAEVAELERGHRAVFLESFPDNSGVVANAAVGVKPSMIAGSDG